MAIAGELAINLIGDISGLKKSFMKAKKETKSLQSRIQKAGQRIGNFGSKMTKTVTGPVAAVGGAMLAAAHKTGQYAKEVQRASQSTGASTKGFQELRYALGQLGIQGDEAQEMLVEVNRVMGEAAAGDEDMAKRLQAVGLSMQDIQNMNADEAFTEIVKGLRNMESQGRKTAISGKLLGEDLSRRLLPALNNNSTSIEELRKRAQELGVVMDKEGIESSANFASKLKSLKQQFMGIVRQLGAEIIPLLNSEFIPLLQNTVAPAVISLVEGLGGLIKSFRQLPGPVKKIITLVGGLATALGPAAMGLASVISALAGPISTVIGLLGGISGGGLIAALSPLLGPAGLIAGAIALFITFDEEIMGFVRGALDLLYKAFVKLKNFLPKYVKSLKEDIISDWNTMIDFFKNLPDRMWNLGKDIIQGLIDGIKNMLNKPVEMVKNLGSDIMGTIKDKLGISSPSKEFEKIGLSMGEGLISGIDKKVNDIQQKTQDMVNTDSLNEISASSGTKAKKITLNITQNITDKATAEHANDDLMQKLKERGNAGGFR